MNADLLALLRADQGGYATLVKIELTNPSAKTIYLGSREVPTGGGGGGGGTAIIWENALDDAGPVNEPGDFLTSDVSLCTFEFRIKPQQITSQTGTDISLDLFHDYYWDGAAVTVYAWDMSLTRAVDAGDALFIGRVERYEPEDLSMRVWCGQRNDWVVDVPGETVTRKKYPRAPDKSLGLVIPIFYGDGRTIPCRETPGAASVAYGAFNQSLIGVFGIRRAAVRGVVADLGKGDGLKGRVIMVGHKCKLWNDDAAGSTPALAIGDRLGEIDPAAGEDFNSAALGAGFTYDDVTPAGIQPFDCFMPVFSTDSQQAAANQGDNARAATDGFNDASYAELDYDAGKREVNFQLPDVSPVGLYLLGKHVYGWSTTPGATHLRAKFVNYIGGLDITEILAATSGLDDKTGAGNPIAGAEPGVAWQFGSYQCRLVVFFDGVPALAGTKARIYFAGLAVKYRPNWPVVTPAWKIQVPGVQDTRQVNTFDPGAPGWHRTSRHHYSHQPHDVWFPAEEKVSADGEYYATLQGWPDDGSGTDTGVADALIERPPDVLRHFLKTYCAQSAGQIETAGSTFGSLVDLRDDLKTWRGGDMKLAYAIDERRKASQAIADMMASALCWAFIDPQDDKWKAVPWAASRDVTYDIPLRREDLISMPTLQRRTDLIANKIDISYSRDARGRKPIFDTVVRPTESRSGHAYRALNDEDTTVVANESDRFDYYDAVNGTITVNLTPGAYTPLALAAHLQGLMQATAVTALVAYGHQIATGQNDTIDINDGANKTATIAAGTYDNPSDLATAAQTALNAVSSNWTVTYSATTRKFTIDRSAGTKTLRFGSGPNLSKSAHVTLGYIYGNVTAGSASDFETERERFVIAENAAFKLLFETGTNGIDAATPRTCGALFGFDIARDIDQGLQYAIAHSPKNNRQTTMANSVALYGERPPFPVELPAVFDTDTAREVRNRLVDLKSSPPVFGFFQTARCPNIGRGMVFETHESIDEWAPYTVPGSDGSWGGKKWAVIDVGKVLQPTLHQEIVALSVA